MTDDLVAHGARQSHAGDRRIDRGLYGVDAEAGAQRRGELGAAHLEVLNSG
jgi:hypothetical protein